MSTSYPIDPFANILARTKQHRREHGCGAYSYQDGPLLTVLAAALKPNRIVEIGTALGYTSMCFAEGAPSALVDTIEMDKAHVKLAREHFEAMGMAGQITVHHGDADEVLATLATNAYDVAFFDGFEPTASILTRLHALLRPGGTLICANLTLGGSGIDVLQDDSLWRSFAFGETALAVKHGG